MDHFRVLYSNTDCIDIHWLRMICMMIKYVDDHFELFSPNVVVPNATCNIEMEILDLILCMY